jgi:pimeloyl-ACP methyl ester carboxylesterase
MALSGRFQTLRSFDNTRIAYASWGDDVAADGAPAVMLANGIACSDTYWRDVVPALAAAGRRVCFHDLRGHGRSGPPANPNEVYLPSHARDLWAVADALGVDDAVLVGHSMGVETVLEAYRLAPGRVRGIVAVAGTFEHPLNTMYLSTAGRYVQAAVELAMEPAPWLTRAVWRLGERTSSVNIRLGKLARMIGPDAPTDVMTEYFSRVARMDPLLLVRFARGMQMHTARDLLPDVTVPVLVLAGARDMLTPPRLAREMVDLLPHGRLEIWDRSGHTLPVDEPERFVRTVRAFVDELAGADLAAPLRAQANADGQ